MRVSSSSQKGFTIVEILVIVVVGMVLLGLVFDIMGSFYYDNTKSLGRTVQDTDTRGSLRIVEAELTNVTGFASSLSVEAPLGNGGGTVWDYRGDDQARRVLIAKVNATTESPDSDTNNDRMPVFLPVSGDCSPLVATPAEISFVYFIAEDPDSPPAPDKLYNLYRRTILPSISNSDYCDGRRPWQKQTCATGAHDPQGRCEADDALLLRNIKSFAVEYFSSSNSETPDVTAADSSDKSSIVGGAQSVRVKVTTTHQLSGQWNTTDADIRITRR